MNIYRITSKWHDDFDEKTQIILQRHKTSSNH